MRKILLTASMGALLLAVAVAITPRAARAGAFGSCEVSCGNGGTCSASWTPPEKPCDCYCSALGGNAYCDCTPTAPS